jgi:hypothetical protein
MSDFYEKGKEIAGQLRDCCKMGDIDWYLVASAAAFIDTAVQWVKAVACDELPPPLPAPENKKPIKHKYGMYKNVLLTDSEFIKLHSEFSDVDKRIDKLSEYLEIHGKPYKSHCAVIRKWARDDAEKLQKENKPENASFDTDEFFNLALNRSNEKLKGS